MALPEPGWQRDPTGRYKERFWNGDRWTDMVRFGGDRTASDPVTRPPGAVGSSTPATARLYAMPVGGRHEGRSVIAAALLLPLLMLLLGAQDLGDAIGRVSAQVGDAVVAHLSPDHAD